MDRTRALFVFLLASLISAQAGGLTAADGGSQTPVSLNGTYLPVDSVALVTAPSGGLFTAWTLFTSCPVYTPVQCGILKLSP